MIRDAARRDEAERTGRRLAAGTDPLSGGGHSGKGQAGAGIEMLTDPQGVDFNDYLRRIYYIVRGNWYA